MNEADDTYRDYGFNYRLRCGHHSETNGIGMHGPLRNIADPIRTIGEEAYCPTCNDLKEITQLRIWVMNED
jgi:hypothetical protein